MKAVLAEAASMMVASMEASPAVGSAAEILKHITKLRDDRNVIHSPVASLLLGRENRSAMSSR